MDSKQLDIVTMGISLATLADQAGPQLIDALILAVVERHRQNDKWGKDRNLQPLLWTLIMDEEREEVSRAIQDGHLYSFYLDYDNPNVGWSPEKQHLLNEITQVTAVGLNWIEQLLREQHAAATTSTDQSPRSSIASGEAEAAAAVYP